MKGVEANGSSYTRSPTFSCLRMKQNQKPSTLEPFIRFQIEPCIKEILNFPLMNFILL